jgi:hypothetical protein
VNKLAFQNKRRPCGVAWDAVREPMVEYIDPDILKLLECRAGIPECP